MKVVQINSVSGRGSTGKICVAVSRLLDGQSVNNYILYGRQQDSFKNSIKYAWDFYAKVHAVLEKLFGLQGFVSWYSTWRLIRILKQINPDIVHLHVLHSHECNISMLLSYLRKKHIKVYWTFHDCWVLTGYCNHFDMVGCDKWKSECSACPQRRDFSWFFDNSTWLHRKKIELLSQMDVTIITPSEWLAGVVKQSALYSKEVCVINNGIDLSVFRPRLSDFRSKYGCEDKFVILSVAYFWGPRKGLDAIIEVSEMLDESFQIVLVGTNQSIDELLPKNIISIHQTHNQKELVEIYSAADVFLNTTREENFPTVNIESLACGTPVLTFNTGGSPEIIDATCGAVVPKNDVVGLKKELERIKKDRPYSREACVERARMYDDKIAYQKYVNLYRLNQNPTRGDSR